MIVLANKSGLAILYGNNRMETLDYYQFCRISIKLKFYSKQETTYIGSVLVG